MINFAGTIAALRLLGNPSMCLPQGTVSTFNDIPVPISKAFARERPPDIRAVILDKDNCFAVPKEDKVYAEYESKFALLRKAYPKTLLVLSNTAGYTSRDPQSHQARTLSSNTGIPVLPHDRPKPACTESIMGYFHARPELGVTHPSQIAIVGDRLLTDMYMANSGGMWGLWVRDGVVRQTGIVGMIVRMEKGLESFLRQRGYTAPKPEIQSPFE